MVKLFKILQNLKFRPFSLKFQLYALKTYTGKNVPPEKIPSKFLSIFGACFTSMLVLCKFKLSCNCN